MAEWLRCLTRKPKVRTAVGSNPTLDSLVTVRNTSQDRPQPCEGNLVAVAGSCSGLMVKHPWPLLEISLSDFRGLATLNINTYIPTLNSPISTNEVSMFKLAIEECFANHCGLIPPIFLSLGSTKSEYFFWTPGISKRRERRGDPRLKPLVWLMYLVRLF